MSALFVINTGCRQVEFTGHKTHPANEETEPWEYRPVLVARGLALRRLEKEKNRGTKAKMNVMKKIEILIVAGDVCNWQTSWPSMYMALNWIKELLLIFKKS